MFFFLFIKISLYFLHPLHLSNMERTSKIAMTTGNTIGSLLLQIFIVVFCQNITGPGQIIIFINQSHIQPCRTRLAVIAVDADSLCFLWGKAAQNGIVFFLLRGIEESKNTVQIFPVAYPGQNRKYARLIKGIFQALVFGQRTLKRGGAGI